MWYTRHGRFNSILDWMKGDSHGRSPIPSCPVLAIRDQPGMLGFKSSAAEKRCIWSVDWPCTRPISQLQSRLESARVPYRPDPSLPVLRVVLAVHSPGRGCRISATHEPGDGDRSVPGRLGGARAVETLDQVLHRNFFYNAQSTEGTSRPSKHCWSEERT